MDSSRYLEGSTDKMIVKPTRPAPPPKVVISERGWMA
jgi:hypothetical protein